MKIIFFGTPYYVVPILEALYKEFKEKSGESPIAAVVTQSPKPVGRKQILEYSPVDTWAHKKNIPKYFKAEDIINNNIKADIGILASYGEMIPQNVIDYFQHGILVIHPSFLPKFRGASPVPAAIITDTNPTGVSIIKMDNKWDHGPILTQFNEEILPDDTTKTLRDRLFERSSDVLIQMLPAYFKGKINLKPQNDAKATFAGLVTKDDAFIPPEYLNITLQGKFIKGQWKMDFIKINGKAFTNQCKPITVHQFIRAMDPWPGAWTFIRLSASDRQVKRLKLLKSHLQPATNNLLLDNVQLEGKKPTTWEQFKAGYPYYSFET